MDRLILRKMSFKSTFQEGKYKDYTVQQVLDLNPFDGKTYLIWVYYNMSNLSFLDEVLEHIGITQYYRIDKPGKIQSKDLYDQYRKEITSRIEFAEYERNVFLGNLQRNKKQKRIKESIYQGLITQNKGYLRGKNRKR